MMSIPAIKAVGFGVATDVGSVPGSKVHDEIVRAHGARPPALFRPSPVRPTAPAASRAA